MSAANASTAAFPEAARMSAAACSARARSRPVIPPRAPRAASPIAVALPIPPVAPVISTTLPAIGSVPAVTPFLDGDDNRSSRLPFPDITDCLAGPTQWVRSVDDRRDLPGFDESLQGDQVLSVLKLDGRAQLLLPEPRPCGRFDDGTDSAEPTTAGRSIVGLQLPGGAEYAPGGR